jgi:cytochrome c553
MHRYSVHDNSALGFADESIPPWLQTTCTSCHDPHTMDPGAGATGLAMPSSLGRISGVTVSGSQVEVASQEYEVCFRCHADTAVGQRPLVSRQIVQTNTRLEFDPAAVSYHPVAAPGKNPDVPSLKPGWTSSSTMSCSDCHGSDTSRRAGGSGPNGVHGSNEPPLLLARYELADYTPESASSYALCYRCHEREGTDGILSDRSFPHRLHVSSSRAPCSVCHDSHGVSSVQGTRINNSHLINFNLRVVFPNNLTGELEYRDTGIFSGSCTLTCHGFGHVNTTYRGGDMFDLLDR